jgi:hypothetical protein
MSERKKDAPTTNEVSVNWEGLARFLGWQGSISDLKRVELDRTDIAPSASARAIKGR